MKTFIIKYILPNFQVIFIGIVFLAYYLVSGSNPENTTKVLQANGFTQISIGGFTWSGRDGLNKTKFNAMNGSGKPIHGYVGYFFTKSNADIVIEN